MLSAAVITDAKVERKGKTYYLDSTIEVNAPREIMFELLTDYDNLHKFSGGLVNTKKYEPNEAGEVRVFTHIRGCVAFLCRNIKKMEKLETEGLEKIVTTLIPKESYNAKKIDSVWELSDLELTENIDTDFTKKLPVVIPSENVSESKAEEVKPLGTKIRYTMEFTPGFWVPPLIGDYLVRKALVSDGTQILNRMERYALQEVQHRKIKQQVIETIEQEKAVEPNQLRQPVSTSN